MIKRRIFIVGTARAGTTLLQSMLGNHPEVHTFPETHFFDRSFAKQPLLRKVQGVQQKGIENARSFVTELGYPELASSIASKYSVKAWSGELIRLLDAMAWHGGKSAWLEKTPLHLHYISLIKTVVHAEFIHMLRDPAGNITSLMHAGTKHPDSFQQGSFKKALKRWTEEFELQKTYTDTPHHHYVKFDELVDDRETVMRKLLESLDMTWHDCVLDHTAITDQIIQGDEAWKAKNREAISASGKKVLSKGQEQEIEDTVAAGYRAFNP